MRHGPLLVLLFLTGSCSRAGDSSPFTAHRLRPAAVGFDSVSTVFLEGVYSGQGAFVGEVLETMEGTYPPHDDYGEGLFVRARIETDSLFRQLNGVERTAEEVHKGTEMWFWNNSNNRDGCRGHRVEVGDRLLLFPESQAYYSRTPAGEKALSAAIGRNFICINRGNVHIENYLDETGGFVEVFDVPLETFVAGVSKIWGGGLCVRRAYDQEQCALKDRIAGESRALNCPATQTAFLGVSCLPMTFKSGEYRGMRLDGRTRDEYEADRAAGAP